MDIVLYTVPHLCVLVVAAYLLARIDFFDGLEAEPRGMKFAAVVAVFSFIALYGVINSLLSLQTTWPITTYTVGIALVSLMFGMRPALCVALISAASILMLRPVTWVADLSALVIALAVCSFSRKRSTGYDGELFGIAAGLTEIARMLLIVAFVRPVTAAKEIVYGTSFTMIVLNGSAVIVFTMIINDVISRRILLEKDTFRRSELNIAKNIQMSLLDKNFDIDPRLKFSAFLRPAMEVGGDLYSFIKRGADTFCFILGDVSGKGVSAAITMSRTMTLFQMNAVKYSSPEEILAAMNDSLCENNSAQMFVTAVLGSLDMNTGVLRWSNAGHTAPFIADAERTAELPRIKGKPLGIIPDLRYKSAEFALDPGKSLFFYTDGVSEAENIAHEQFGKGGILATLSSTTSDSPEGLNTMVVADVDKFADGVPQFDDITAFAVALAPRGRLEYSIPNDIGAAAKLVSKVPLDMECLTDDMNLTNTVDLVIEEIVTNTVKFGYGDGRKDKIKVTVELAEETAKVTTTDSSDPFDPFSAPEPDLTGPLCERRMGGLGIHLLRHRVASHSYSSENGVNTLKIGIARGRKV